MQENIQNKKYGNLILENRQKLTVSGINDVESFDGDKIVLLTNDGTLTITGQNMKVKKLSSESGEATVEGEIDGLSYLRG